MTLTLLVDFHCHTCASGDSLIQPRRLLARAHRLGLDRIAITDHNTLVGALEAARLEPGFVIVGEEIRTTEGELLGLFVSEEVPGGLSAEGTIQRLREQRAFICIPHPFDSLRAGGWSEARLRDLIPLVDALEVMNARVWTASANRRAAALAAAVGLPGIAGSDAHSYCEIGRACLRLPPFHDADSLRTALRSAQAVGDRSSPFVHLASRWAAMRTRLGWRHPTRPRAQV